MRRLVAFSAIGAGLALIVFTFASSAFLRMDEGQQLRDRFREVTTTKGFAQFGANVAEATKAVDELVTKTYPKFASDSGMSTKQYTAYVASNFSDVSRGVTTVHDLPNLITPITSGVAALPDGKFQPLYDLPVGGISLASVPWLLLGGGAAVLVLGLIALGLPGRRTTLLVLVAGIALILVPVAASLPSKTEQTGKILELCDYGLSADAALRSEQASYYTDAMIRQLKTELFPAVAKQRHVSVAMLQTQLKTESPALSKWVDDWTVVGPATLGFAAAIRESVSQYAQVRDFPFEETPWLLIALGCVVVVVAGAALVESRRSRDQK